MKKIVLFFAIAFVFLFRASSVSASAIDIGNLNIGKNVFDDKYIRKSPYATDQENAIFDLLYDEKYANTKKELFEFLRTYKYYYIAFDGVYFWNDDNIGVYTFAENSAYNSNLRTLHFYIARNDPQKDANYFKISIADVMKNDYSIMAMSTSEESYYYASPCFTVWAKGWDVDAGVNNKYFEKDEQNYSFIGFYLNVPITYKAPQSFLNNDSERIYSSVTVFGKRYEIGSQLYQPISSFLGNIDTNMFSKVEFIFDVPSDQEFIFDLDLEVTHAGSLPAPYLTFKKTYGDETTDEITHFTTLNGTKHVGKFGMDMARGIEQMRLVFDIQDYRDSLLINFTSSHNFRVEYTSRIDTEQYMKTIDMSNLYGLYLIPRTSSNDNYQPIFTIGDYNIEVRRNYSNDNTYEVVKKFTNFKDKVFQVQSYYNELNNVYYFMNNLYGTENQSSITFDTRYFSYAIKEYIYSTPSIDNPNTGGSITFPENDRIEIDSSLLDYLTSSKNFLLSLGGYIIEMCSVVAYFFNSMNPFIRNAVISIFVVLVLCVIITFGRK